MKLLKHKLILISAIIIIIILLTFMLSNLKPYLALILAIIIAFLMVLGFQLKWNSTIKVLLILSMCAAVIFIIFPIKVVFSRTQFSLVTIMPILYGLPTTEGWQKIDNGEYFPGGSVISILDPKYVIIVRK
ncbi:MAG: hypothetical protein WC460_04355 [Patescibacteria group bacterium]